MASVQRFGLSASIVRATDLFLVRIACACSTIGARLTGCFSLMKQFVNRCRNDDDYG